MKDRQCLWMGIRPSGDGDREMLRQYEESAGVADVGERCPFMLPFGDCFNGGTGGGASLVAERAFCWRAKVLGERDRERARFSREESEESEEDDWAIEEGEVYRLRPAERVMGAK